MGMYPNECNTVMSQSKALGCDVVDRNPTVGENIDTKIAMLRKEIERLEESKVTLGPLMDMRIRDIRDAMSY